MVPYVKTSIPLLDMYPEYVDKWLRRRNLAELTAKAKYSQRPIVNKYREGKVKSSPIRAVK